MQKEIRYIVSYAFKYINTKSFFKILVSNWELLVLGGAIIHAIESKKHQFKSYLEAFKIQRG